MPTTQSQKRASHKYYNKIKQVPEKFSELQHRKKKNYETFKNSEGYEKHKQNQQEKYNQMKQDPVKYSDYKEKKLERYYELKKVNKINN